MRKRISRRDFLRSSAAVATGAALAACAPTAPQIVEVEKQVPVEKVVKETVVVEKEVPVVKEVVVTTAPEKPSKVELLYWVVVDEHRQKVYQAGVDRFNEKYGPGLYVKMEPVSGDCVEVQQKILIAIASGWVPDVVHMDTMFINQVAPTGVLLPLEELPGARELADACWPGAMEPLIMEGHIWSYPIRANSIQYYYDKDIAYESGLDPEKPPVYLDELTEWAAKMTKKSASGAVERYGYDYKVSKNASWSTHAFYTLIWGYSGKMLDEQGMAAWNSEAGIKALEWWVDLVKNEYTPTKSIDNGLELGKVASTVTGEWEIYHLKNEVGINLGVSPFPYPRGGEHVIPLGGRTLTMYKANPYPEEGWKLIQHVMGKEEQMFITKNLGGLTPRRDVLDDPWWDENPEYKLTLEDMASVRAKDATPYFLEMVDIMLEVFEKAVIGGVPAAQALNEGAEKFNETVKTGTK